MNYIEILLMNITTFNKKYLIKCIKILFKFNKLIRKAFLVRIKFAITILDLELIRCSILEYILRNTNLDINDLIFMSQYSL